MSALSICKVLLQTVCLTTLVSAFNNRNNVNNNHNANNNRYVRNDGGSNFDFVAQDFNGNFGNNGNNGNNGNFGSNGNFRNNGNFRSNVKNGNNGNFGNNGNNGNNGNFGNNGNNGNNGNFGNNGNNGNNGNFGNNGNNGNNGNFGNNGNNGNSGNFGNNDNNGNNGNVNIFSSFSGGNFNNGGGGTSMNCQNNVCTVCNNYACRRLQGIGPMSINCRNNNPCEYCSGRQCETVVLPTPPPNSSNHQNMKIHHSRGCVPAYCPADCEGYVLLRNNGGTRCPICKCRDFGIKEPCNSNADCESGDCIVDRGLCKYPRPPGDVLDECAFDSNCASTDECAYGGFCTPGKGNKPRHLQGVQCVFENQCPGNMICRDMTCYDNVKGDARHEPGIQCVFSHQCSFGFSCDNRSMSCMEGGPYADHEPGQCVFNNQCSPGYRCMNMTCVRLGG